MILVCTTIFARRKANISSRDRACASAFSTEISRWYLRFGKGRSHRFSTCTWILTKHKCSVKPKGCIDSILGITKPYDNGSGSKSSFCQPNLNSRSGAPQYACRAGALMLSPNISCIYLWMAQLAWPLPASVRGDDSMEHWEAWKREIVRLMKIQEQFSESVPPISLTHSLALSDQ